MSVLKRNDLLVGAHRFVVPLPGVFKGVNLGAGLGAVLLGEKDVVILAGVERRVEIDEVYGLVLDVAFEDFEIVAVVELVLVSGHGFG